MEGPVGVATEPVGPLPLICALGDPALAKKPDGYISVMVLPAASAPPAVVVKLNVAAAELFPATRSDAAIANETSVTCPPITPELTPADTILSTLVESFIPFELSPVSRPIDKPVNVTVTWECDLKDVVPVVMTIDVDVGDAAVPEAPLLMMTPTLDERKKSDG
jgi:hypothetical protein